MLKSIVARTRNPYTKAIHKVMTFGPNSMYRVIDVEGLGPVKGEVSKMSLPQAGGRILAITPPMRNIVITVQLRPDHRDGFDETLLRRNLYNVYGVGNEIEMLFDTDILGVMTINGRVDSHEPVIFSSRPTVTISILCEYPYFEDSNPRTVITVPPQTNPVLKVNYPGTVPVGFEFEAAVSSPSSFIDMFGEGAMPGYIGAGYDFEANDLFRFSSIRGEKRIERVRSSATNSLLGYIRGSLSSMYLVPGENQFRYSRSSSQGMKFTFKRAYEGL